MYRNLSPSTKVVRLSGPVAAGVGDVVCPPVAMSGFAGILILALLGGIAAGGVAGLKAQGGALADGSDKADVAASLITANDTQDNQTLELDIAKPKVEMPFITPVVTRTTANVALDGVVAILYNPSNAPCGLDATTAAAKVLSEPRFGAATG